jgi:two-component system NtrC family sensor kinase
VFTNILLNAAEAMGGEGEIDVETFVTGGGDKVAVRISDAGPGIPPENLGQVFEPFFTSKETGHGTGLGLAISYGIVENHEGTRRAENTPEGGATFIVELPLSREETTTHELFFQHPGDR